MTGLQASASAEVRPRRSWPRTAARRGGQHEQAPAEQCTGDAHGVERRGAVEGQRWRRRRGRRRAGGSARRRSPPRCPSRCSVPTQSAVVRVAAAACTPGRPPRTMSSGTVTDGAGPPGRVTRIRAHIAAGDRSGSVDVVELVAGRERRAPRGSRRPAGPGAPSRHQPTRGHGRPSRAASRASACCCVSGHGLLSWMSR